MIIWTPHWPGWKTLLDKTTATIANKRVWLLFSFSMYLNFLIITQMENWVDVYHLAKGKLHNSFCNTKMPRSLWEQQCRDSRHCEQISQEFLKTLNIPSKNHGMVWVGMDLKAHPVSPPAIDHLQLSQVAPSPNVQSGLEHCQGWSSHSFSEQFCANWSHFLHLNLMLLE